MESPIWTGHLPHQQRLSACYTTSSPAIDPDLQFVYSYGLDGFVHKYQVGNGTEITSGGWPEHVTLKDSTRKNLLPLPPLRTRTGTTISMWPMVAIPATTATTRAT